MHDRLNASTIVIESSADCYFYPDLDFTVERVTQTVWRVIDVKAVDATKQLRCDIRQFTQLLLSWCASSEVRT